MPFQPIKQIVNINLKNKNIYDIIYYNQTGDGENYEMVSVQHSEYDRR